MAWVNVDGDTTSLEYTARRATAVIPSSPIQADVSTVYAFGTTPILRHNQLMPMGRLRGPRFVLKKAVVATHRFVIGHLFGFSELTVDDRKSQSSERFQNVSPQKSVDNISEIINRRKVADLLFHL